MSPKCFVCDVFIAGKFHQLSTYNLKYSKQSLVERLAKLLSDRMVLICRPGDIICAACVTTMESLDKLENETEATKAVIFESLEKKYLLDKSRKENKPAAIPQIPSVMPSPQSSFSARKKEAQDGMSRLAEEVENADPRSKIILKCGTCQYTTNYLDFESRHIQSSDAKEANVNFQDGSRDKVMFFAANDSNLNDYHLSLIKEHQNDNLFGESDEMDSVRGDYGQADDADDTSQF